MSLCSNTIISLAFNPAEGVLKRFPAIIGRGNAGMDRSIIPERLRTHQQHTGIKQLKVRGREGGEEEESLFFFKASTDTEAREPTENRPRHPRRSELAPFHPNHCSCYYSTRVKSVSLMRARRRGRRRAGCCQSVLAALAKPRNDN